MLATTNTLKYLYVEFFGVHTMEHNGQLVGMGFDFVTWLQTVDSYFGCKLKKMNQI